MFRSVIAVCALLLSAMQAFAQSDFKVTLLGTASPQARTDRFGPSTLVEAGGQVLLFDAGRGVPIRMNQLKIPIGKIDVLFLTHFHSDHVSGIPDVWLSGWLGSPMGRRKTPFHVVGPTGANNLMKNLEKAYALDISIREADEKLPPQGVEIKIEEFAKDGVVFEKNRHGDLVNQEIDAGAVFDDVLIVARVAGNYRRVAVVIDAIAVCGFYDVAVVNLESAS
jgi:ribonuclease BN (tRNA processing enzyme)